MVAAGEKYIVTLKAGEVQMYELLKPPNGECLDCTVIQGAGNLKFYEDDRKVAEYLLSTAPGKLFFIRLNTAPGGYKWRIEATGIGTEGPNEFECTVSEGDGQKEVITKVKKTRKKKTPPNFSKNMASDIM